MRAATAPRRLELTAPLMSSAPPPLTTHVQDRATLLVTLTVTGYRLRHNTVTAPRHLWLQVQERAMLLRQLLSLLRDATPAARAGLRAALRDGLAPELKARLLSS